MKTKATSPPGPRTLEVLVSNDNMQIDQTNVTINIDDTNQFEGSKLNEPNTKDIEELRQIEDEKKKVEEAKQKLLEDEKKRKEEAQKRKEQQKKK